MNKLIIPNTGFEPGRFLWMIEPGDIILLDKMPDKIFLNYLCKIKNIPAGSFKIIIPKSSSADLSNPEVLLDKALIKNLKANLGNNHTFILWAYFLNSATIKLANRLSIPIDKKRRELVENNMLEKLNDKVEFKNIAKKYHISHPEGATCDSKSSLIEAIKNYITLTGKVIVKQPHAGGGLGNIGISTGTSVFLGVHKSYELMQDNLNSIVDEIWSQYIDSYNNKLIVEVYYPQTKTITAIMEIDENTKQIRLVNTGIIYFVPIGIHQEKKISSGIQAIQMPAEGICHSIILNLVNDSFTIAQHIQQEGYRGLFSVDAIITDDSQLILTEINVRNGGETHINYLICKIFDTTNPPFMTASVILSVVENFPLPMENILQRLKDSKLDFTNKKGIILVNLNHNTKQLQYLVLGESETDLTKLQQKFHEEMTKTESASLA